LKISLEGIHDNEQRENAAHKFFDDLFVLEKVALREKASFSQTEWDKINDNAMAALSEVVEQKWPNEDKVIRAEVSFNPISPYNLRSRSFSVFYKASPAGTNGTAFHELLHLIYFEKWKTVFPKTPESGFRSPHLVWVLSEMMPGVILNDERIQNVFKHEFRSNWDMMELKIKGRPAMSYIREFYDGRKDFEDFLRRSYAFAKVHEKEITK